MLSGVRAGEFGAAGLLRGREFHELDAGVVRIVEIKLPLAVAADLGLIEDRDNIFLAQTSGFRFNVRNSYSDVIHDAEGLMGSVRPKIEHVFEPVSPVGDLHVDPTGIFVRSSAVPIQAKSQNVFVEV